MRPLLAAFAVCALLAACSHGESQAGLPTAKIVIDTHQGPATFKVELAADDASRERGLMYRTTLAPDAGMLFEFSKPAQVVFWMKNTPLSLDMIFIKQDGTISTIASDTIPYSEDNVPASEPVRAVLEIDGGRAAALDIQPGDRVHGAIFGNAP